MAMNPHRAKEIFIAVIQGNIPANDRGAWIEQACEGDAELVQRVQQLLSAHAVEDSFLAPPAAVRQGMATVEDSEQGVLGDFRIIREVGRGGMGVVYEADQLSLRRRVALKVLPFASVLDKRQLQRFQIEAMAAARLHHPHIVPVYQVGSERAVHFYAMQYIEGRNVSEWIEAIRNSAARSHAREDADPQRPTADPEATLITGPPIPPAAIRRETTALDGISTEYSTNKAKYHRSIAALGIQAAAALGYAHEHGILHRDVKPSNLMLDDQGHLWVTDFGLARIEGDSGLTMSGDLLGTLRYMSPEQVLGQRVTIDERTDVYSLGVTLYEMLTLRPAFSGADRAELLRQIAFEDPVPLRKLDPSIPLDLETIVLKAACKSSHERYDSAKDLQDDLQRFLNHAAIKARRATLRQRLTKWSIRHTTLLWSATAVLLVVAVVLGASTAWVLSAYKRERQASAESRAVIEFLTNDLLAQANPDHQPDRNLKVRTVVDRAAQEIGNRFAEAPLAKATILLTLGKTYRSLGEYPAANLHITQAIEILAAERGEEHPDTLRARSELALLRSEEGRLEDAERLYREVLVAQQRVLGDQHADTMTTLHGLGCNLFASGQIGPAAKLHHRVLQFRETTLGETHPETLAVRLDIARYRVSVGAFSLAQPDLEQMLKILPADDAGANDARGGLAVIALHQGRVDEAVERFQDIVESVGQTYGPAHPYALLAQCGLATCFLKGERFIDAESLCRELLGKATVTFGAEDRVTGEARILLAVALLAQQRLEEAEPLFLESLECDLRLRGKSHSSVMVALKGLRWIFALQGKQEQGRLLSTWVRRPQLQTDNGGSLFSELFEEVPGPQSHDYYLYSIFGSARPWPKMRQPTSEELAEDPLYKVIKGLFDGHPQHAGRLAGAQPEADDP